MKKSKPKIGLHEDISFDEYRKIDAVNASLLKNFMQSPAHVLYARHNDEESQPLFIGRAVHCAVLEPDRFAAEFIVADCEKKNAKAYTTAVAANPTKTVLTKVDERVVKGISESITSETHKQAYTLLCQESWNEITAVWQDATTGLYCKARADRYILDQDRRPVIIDLKTAADASVTGFSKSIANYGYHVSAAFYCDGFAALTGKDHERFIIIAAEKEPPFEIAVYEIEPSALEAGRQKYRSYLERYKGCRERGVWPGYPDALIPIGLPQWAYND